jgi:hypothetical protein
MVSINVLAVILAALSTMVVGSLWYSPKGFYQTWAKLAHVKKDPDFNNKKATFLYGGAYITSLVTAIVLAYFGAVIFKATGGSYLGDMMLAGFLGWLGFTAARIHMHDSFEGRRKKLTLLNVTHELVTLMVMAIIIGLLG